MKILDVVQGQPEWHSARAQHRCASEAPAMMGASKYMTRNDLLKLKATGIGEEIDANKQRLFDRGHDAEAAIRPHIEEMLGEDLYPATGVDGELLASFDGITMGEDTVFEHKLWNEGLAAAVRSRHLKPEYYWQLEHQLAVSKAQRVIFVVSDGTPEKCVHMEYLPQPGRREALLAGWKQFAEDLANYQHIEASAPVMAAPVEALPAVSVRMDGAIAVISNLDVFGDKLKAFVELIDKNPSTDQAFADAEAAVKTLQKAQDALEQAEASALAQTSSIDDMRRTVAMYKEMARSTRLMLEKVVKQRKETIRIEIQQKAAAAFSDHIATINKRLGKIQMPHIPVDFAGAMKGKKTITSVQSAVDNELARAKIDANSVAERISTNITSLRDLAADYPFLFSDVQSIVLKENDDLIALVKTRISEHQLAEQKRIDAERERIRAEEEAKAHRDAQAKYQQDLQNIREEEQAKARAEEIERRNDLKSGSHISSAETLKENANYHVDDIDSVATTMLSGPPLPPSAPMCLDDINALIYPIFISDKGLLALGIYPVDHNNVYESSSLPAIVRAIVGRLNKINMEA